MQATQPAAGNETRKYPVGIAGVKIEQADREVPATEPPPLAPNSELKVIGKPTTRLDGRLKVTGAAKYTADVNLPGMLYGRMLSSPVAAARIKSIDTSAAEKMPSVKAVHILEHLLGGAQSADEKGGTQYPLIRYQGQPILALAAQTPAQAQDAIDAIK